MPGLSPWADESMVALQWSARPPRSEPLLTTAPDCLAGSSPPSSAPVSPCAPSPQAPSLNARRFSAPVLRVPRRPHAVQHTFLHTENVGVCMNVCCKIDTSAYCKTRLSVDHPAPLRARLRHPKASGHLGGWVAPRGTPSERARTRFARPRNSGEAHVSPLTKDVGVSHARPGGPCAI